MRVPCINSWLLLCSGFAILRGIAAPPAEDTDLLHPGAADGVAEDINPETFLGACPEYAQYASHMQ